MKWFAYKTRNRLLKGFGGILLMIAILIAVLFVNRTSIIKSQRNIYQKDLVDVVTLLEMRANQNAIRALMLEKLISVSKLNRNKIDEEIEKKANEIDDSREMLNSFYDNAPESEKMLVYLDKLLEAYRDGRKQQNRLITQGRTGKAISMGYGMQDENFKELSVAMKKMGDLSIKRIKDSTEDSIQSSTHSLYLILALGLFIIGACIGIFTKIILNLRSITGDINDGIEVLGASSGEIVTATTQVAASAGETATAVTETTTTVEEVRQTAQLSAQKARAVQDTAKRSTQAAQEGLESVEKTIEGMINIQRQMGIITDIIINLSEQTRTIGEITATVTDIADQSNILAVNAAIEAVKAGEQGIGFTVVAQEIKSLAEQSKQATGQVRGILNDIQKAVNQAVLSTEQGSKAVETGNLLAKRSGDAISLLAETVNDATQAATQIAASSQQQLVGMDQIAPSMENIKLAMLQNATSTEQSQKAAKNLHDLGLKLKLLVEKFQV